MVTYVKPPQFRFVHL